MKKSISLVLACLLAVTFIAGCENNETVKIGVSFGVGAATRWKLEEGYMMERAKNYDMEIESRLNLGDTEKTQLDDCIELIDSGIQVLILIPRDANDVEDILNYAKKKSVKVISYARVVLGKNVDLFVGYDSFKIGQNMGIYAAEYVASGDYIILQGDKGDNNAKLIYDGMLEGIAPIKNDINVILDDHVSAWSQTTSEEMVYDAVKKNGGKIDAILASNDTLAAGARAALDRLGVKDSVIITGMDAQLDAVKRISTGKQSMSIHLALQELSNIAIDQAYNMAKGKEPGMNAVFDNDTEKGVNAYLISGKTITKENLDKYLIEAGVYTKEEVYG